MKRKIGIALVVAFVLLFGCTSSGQVSYFLQEPGQLHLYFCPHENCEETLLAQLENAKESIHCALYEIDLPSVQQKLKEKHTQIDVKIITDSDYIDQFNGDFVHTDSW